MANIQRQRVTWTGGTGGDGISTFFFTDAGTAQSALHVLFSTLVAFVPDGIVLNIESGGDVIDASDGTLASSWTGAATATMTNARPGINYAAPVGFQIKWETQSIVHGHHVRGRTYVVPALEDTFGPDGLVTSAAQAILQPVITTFVTAVAGNMVIWNRPITAAPAHTSRSGVITPAKVFRPGGFVPMSSGSVPLKPVILSSRRD